MTRLLIRAGKLPYERVDPFTTLQRNLTGTNVGNMLFQQAVVKSLSLPEYTLEGNGLGLRVEHAPRINDSCDLLVLPFANQFRPAFADRLTAMADAIGKLRVPVVVVGIGCQTDLDYDMSNLEPIKEPVKRFVAAVLDRSASIGVRGACTAQYLKGLGFSDVDVIGCPSMFMDGPELKRPRPVTTFGRATRLSVNISAPGEQAKFSTSLDKMGHVIARAVSDYEDVEYIPQQNNSLKALLVGGRRATDEHAAIPEETYRELYARGRVTAFVDPQTWLAHLAERDFVFGTRLHGGIAALLSGTPAHLIAHDSRTLELAEYHDVPHRSIRTMCDDQDPCELYQASDYTSMVTNHGRRFVAYADFLRKNGLRNVFSDGDGGAGFEARMAAADFPPRVVSPVRWQQRLAWLREHQTRRIKDRLHAVRA